MQCAIFRLLQEASGDKEVLKKAIKDFEVLKLDVIQRHIHCSSMNLPQIPASFCMSLKRTMRLLWIITSMSGLAAAAVDVSSCDRCIRVPMLLYFAVIGSATDNIQKPVCTCQSILLSTAAPASPK
jgi:hypothetical protein